MMRNSYLGKKVHMVISRLPEDIMNYKDEIVQLYLMIV